jgi:hypothetical protein
MFKGYCFLKDGSYIEPVNLKDEEEAVNYCSIQMSMHHEIRIVDEDDCIVLHAKKGKIIFPTKDIEDIGPL